MGNFCRCGLLIAASWAVATNVFASEEQLDLSRTVYGPYIGVFGTAGFGNVETNAQVTKSFDQASLNQVMEAFAGTTLVDYCNAQGPDGMIPICGSLGGSSSSVSYNNILALLLNGNIGYEIITHNFLLGVGAFYGASSGIESTLTMQSSFVSNQGESNSISEVSTPNLSISRKIDSSFGIKPYLGFMINDHSVLFVSFAYSKTDYNYSFSLAADNCVASTTFDSENASNVLCVPQSGDAYLLDSGDSFTTEITGKAVGLGLKNFINLNWDFTIELTYTKYDSFVRNVNNDLSIANDAAFQQPTLPDNLSIFTYSGTVQSSINLVQLNLGVNYHFHV